MSEYFKFSDLVPGSSITLMSSFPRLHKDRFTQGFYLVLSVTLKEGYAYIIALSNGKVVNKRYPQEHFISTYGLSKFM